MKLIAYILMALATMAGSISAATAYLVPIEAGVVDDERLHTITLGAPAGAFDPSTDEGEALEERLGEIRKEQKQARDAEKPEPLIIREEITVDTPPLSEVETEKTGTQLVKKREAESPIAKPGDELSPELLEILRANEVEFVKSTSFNIGIWLKTWPSWVFLVCVAVLFGGAMMVRAASRAAGRAAMDAARADSARPDTLPSDPAALAMLMQKEVERIVAEVNASPDESHQLALIVDRVGEMQTTLIPAFAASRPAIIAKMGMGGYAQVMDAFAGFERKINRAWSAAADNATAEALDSLQTAHAMAPAVYEHVTGH